MFWSNYPWWKHWTNSLFSSFPFHTLPPPSDPPGTFLLSYNGVPSSTPPLLSIVNQACHFLSIHFAPTSAHPMLQHTPESLLGPNDALYLLLSDSPPQDVIGTIRYHSIGTFQHTLEPIYVVDAFCIHPAWRKKGLATFLLATLHYNANQNGLPHALFLKEGAPLPYPVLPALLGQYAYRMLPQTNESHNTVLVPLQDAKARRWMTHFLTSFPNTFLVIPSPSLDISWFVYRRPTVSVLVGVQDAHQVWRGGSIGWVTFWLETPTTTEDDRRIITRSLAPLLSPHYRWLWINRAWVGGGDTLDPEWQEDGPFQWYTYQWATGPLLGQSYGIPA